MIIETKEVDSKMESFKTYEEWEPILEEEEDCKVYDPDGLRMVIREGKRDLLMTKSDALKYFWYNTMVFGPKFIEKVKDINQKQSWN